MTTPWEPHGSLIGGKELAKARAEIVRLHAEHDELRTEHDRFRDHSVILNRVAWKIDTALGYVGPDDSEHEGPVGTRIDELIGELEKLRIARGN